MKDLHKQLKQQHLSFRKAKNDEMNKFYSYLLGELDNKASELDSDRKVIFPDDKVQATLIAIKKSLLKGQPIEAEINELDRWIPEELTAESIRTIFSLMPDASLGEKMGHLKKNYAGQYDGKLASQLARE